jgi:hypothetical protein
MDTPRTSDEKIMAKMTPEEYRARYGRECPNDYVHHSYGEGPCTCPEPPGTTSTATAAPWWSCPRWTNRTGRPPTPSSRGSTRTRVELTDEEQAAVMAGLAANHRAAVAARETR